MTTTPAYSRIVDVAVVLPETRMSSAEVEDRIAATNPDLDIPRGLMERMSGVAYRHVAPPDCWPSDIGVAAARKLLDKTGCDIAEIDLIIFAAASSDGVEPATAHVVSGKLGANCPVFDVKNAANAFINAIEISDAFLRAGTYQRILIVCGETPSHYARWTMNSVEEFLGTGPVFTWSDAGSAVLMESSTEPGILATRFTANSAAWRTVWLPYERIEPEGLGIGQLEVNYHEYAIAMDTVDLEPITGTMAKLGLTMDDFACVCVHVAALGFRDRFCARAGIPLEKTTVTIVEHGNLAANGLSVDLAHVVESGQVKRGDLVALIGPAAGVSLGMVVIRW
ncbi:3-oxoacyl-ACP synthase III family protein [Nocardia sp. NPDC051052]|uniref:3-oxoacyl-ACP synthase III family protein n=1 Tax=Nocardia sp. NPDC051052 TaxID=3364322 RepID=UPI0037A9F667